MSNFDLDAAVRAAEMVAAGRCSCTPPIIRDHRRVLNMQPKRCRAVGLVGAFQDRQQMARKARIKSYRHR